MQELLKKIDNDLDLKYNPEFKDEFQLQTLLRDLDVSRSSVGNAEVDLEQVML